jgi:hypothetical protein
MHGMLGLFGCYVRSSAAPRDLLVHCQIPIRLPEAEKRARKPIDFSVRITSAKKAAKRRSERKPKVTTETRIITPGIGDGADWSSIGYSVKVDGRLWTTKMLADMWKLAMAPHNGKSLKTRQALPEINPCTGFSTLTSSFSPTNPTCHASINVLIA